MKKYRVSLPGNERRYLRDVVRRGRHSARVITRARILLLAQKGKTDREISQALDCSTDTVHQQRKRYHERASVREAIHDAPRPGQPPKLTPEHEAFIVATACTQEPPPGHAHWEPQGLKAALLAAYDDIQSVGNETIRRLLVRHKLKPWREKNVVHPEAHARIPGADGQPARPVHRAAARGTRSPLFR